MRKIETYDRFHRHIRAWAAREVDCLVVLGEAGTGKTHSYRDVLGNRSCHES